MWKLSTAFFPCSKEAFTRTPGPSAGSSVTAVSPSPAAVQSEPLGQQGMISGMVLSGPKLKPWLEGSHTTGVGVRGHSGPCCGTVPTVTVGLCCAFAVIRTARVRLLGQ